MTEPKNATSDVPTRRRKPADGASKTPPAGTRAAPTPEELAGKNVPIFETAGSQKRDIATMRAPDMQRGFQVVVNDLFAQGFDVVEEYQAVIKGLQITDALTPERLKRAANEQEKIANRAHQLYIVAKVEVAAYMRETEGLYGAIREAGIQALESDKATGVRTKQITDADAKSAAAALYPDAWADICTRRDRAEAMLKQLENLAQLARSRCYTVSNMAHPGSRSI